MMNSDDDDPDKFVHFAYQGFDRALGQYVIFGMYYEWFTYELIDFQSGDTTRTWNEPVVSPDRDKFIVGNADLEAGFTSNGIQLFSNTHPAKLIAQRELMNWGPASIRWKSNDEVYVKVLKWEEKVAKTVEDYVKLTFKEK